MITEKAEYLKCLECNLVASIDKWGSISRSANTEDSLSYKFKLAIKIFEVHRKYSVSVILFLLGTFSCVEPFEVESIPYKRVLVVDGLLTDEEKAHEVKLFYTYPLAKNDGEPEPATQAEVWITDQHSTSQNLREATAGTYVTKADFKGIPGNAYTLHMRLPNGVEYKSAAEKLIPSPPIDRLYGRYLQKTVETGTVENGVQLFVDTRAVHDSIDFFRYEWEETFKVTVPIPSVWDYNSILGIRLRDKPLDTCFVSRELEDIRLKSIVGQSEHRVSEFPIRFLNETGRHLNERYFIKVRQYAISQNTLSFYGQLKDARESTGSLFDKQPGTIQGNIASTSDLAEIVQGYFEVSGVSTTERYFMPEPFHDEGLKPFEWEFNECTSGVSLIDTIQRYFNIFPDQLIVQIVDEHAFLTDEFCSDCRVHGGGTLKRPDFWID